MLLAGLGVSWLGRGRGLPMMGVPAPSIRKTWTCPSTIVDRPDLSAFTRLDGLGFEVTGQRIEADHAVFACRICGEDRWCRRCGGQGICCDTVVRRLAHES